MKSIVRNISLAFSLITSGVAISQAAPLEVEMSDLLGKVYGVADPGKSRQECRSEVTACFNAAPTGEDGAEWLLSADGFVVSYDGMTPEGDAMARYEGDRLSDYGYVFYFPYDASGREAANIQQCRFCTAMLDELRELGVILGADPMTQALFDVMGVYDGGDIRLMLTENVVSENQPEEMATGMIPADREGEFVLMISVIPAEFLTAR